MTSPNSILIQSKTRNDARPISAHKDWLMGMMTDAFAANLAAAVQEAKAAGELARAFAQSAGVSLPEQAIAYHVAFADKFRELGAPVLCPCDLCTGGEGGSHGH